MQPTPSARSSTLHPISLAGGIVAGTVLIVSGLTLAYATLATPLISSLTGGGRFGASAGIGGAVAWPFALAAMALFLGVGAARLAEVLAAIKPARHGKDHPLAVGLPDDVLLIEGLDVGDGRAVPLVLVGGFGAAVVRELPAAGTTRRQGAYWEAHTADGWIRIDNPLDRASRDAERVRRWFSQDDRDFVVRVYAAVVAPDAAAPRTPTCAVITTGQLPAWLASLPVQRSLTEARRGQLAAMVRGRR